jgi:hypothetical protein
MERFVVVLFFIGLIMAAIFWLPEKLGLGLENSTFCLGAAFITALVIVLRAGIHKR